MARMQSFQAVIWARAETLIFPLPQGERGKKEPPLVSMPWLDTGFDSVLDVVPAKAGTHNHRVLS
jgi:hypothetical protein